MQVRNPVRAHWAGTQGFTHKMSGGLGAQRFDGKKGEGLLLPMGVCEDIQHVSSVGELHSSKITR